MLTHMQAEALDFIETYQKQNWGASPSFEELKQLLGISSKAGVSRLLDALEERGFIHRRRNRSRAIEVLPRPSELSRFPSKQLVDELARRSEAKAA